jgi:pantothenate kinase type III
MRLLADCGNSTVKLALVHQGGVWLHDRLAGDAAALTAFIAPHREAISELVVLATGRTATVVLAWAATQGWPLRHIGVEVPLPDVGQYPGCGLDRVCAGLAAVAQEGACVVIDGGTATTITAWGADGRMLGGLILPGAAACLRGIAVDAPALPLVTPLAADASALQRDTAGALGAAVGIGYPAMVAACAARVQHEAALTALVVTGGNAPAWLGGVLPRRAYRPSLVCEGMEVALKRAGGIAV